MSYTTYTRLQEARQARGAIRIEDPNVMSMALNFPPIHVWFEFEGEQRHATWNGLLWEPHTDTSGTRHPHQYEVSVEYGCGGTLIGGTFILNGIVQTPQHMEWDSTFGREERNLRFCQAANAAILEKAGADHVLRWGTQASRGLDCPPPRYPKLAPGLEMKTAYNACYTFGRELRETYPGLTDTEVDTAFNAWGPTFAEDDKSDLQESALGIPFLVTKAGMTRDDVQAIMTAKPRYGYPEGELGEGWPVTPVFDTLEAWGRFGCHEGYEGKKYAHTPLVMGNAYK